MFARLWWKDARQFGPAWALIVLATMGGFLLVGRSISDPAPRDALIYGIALMGSCMYALAISTAAIAGERENRTLRLLDTMPAPRGRVWDGKASFSLLSAVALTIVLLGLAELQSEPGDFVRIGRIGGPVAMLWVALGVIALVLEAIGWGLLWSALLDHVLAAAALAVCCLCLATPLSGAMGGSGGFEPDSLAHDAPIRLVFAALLAGASRWLFLASGPPHRTWWIGRARLEWPARAASTAPVADAAPATRIRAAWPRAMMSLAWQANREARAAWPGLALLGLGMPLVFQAVSATFDNASHGLGLAMMLNPLVALLAGVGVFHAEQRGRSFRFLAHHGVRPAMVWPIKVGTWLLGLVLIWAAYPAMFALSELYGLGIVRPEQFGPSPAWFLYGIGLAGCFAAGLLCGMAIKRGITAALVAVVVLVASLVPIGLLTSIGLMSWGWAAAAPVAVLAVSWAWTGPWMLDRPGAGRWLRLGGLLGAASAVLLPLYIGARAWGVPDPGPLPADLRARLTVASESGDENAAPLYREATRRLVSPEQVVLIDEGDGMGGGMIAEMGDDAPPDQAPAAPAPYDDPEQAITWILASGWDPEAAAPAAWLRANADVLELLREASTRPYRNVRPLDRLTAFTSDGATSPDDPPLIPMARLVALSGRELQHRGDLDGAWDELMVLFRIARQPTRPLTTSRANDSLLVERIALGQAMAWALDDDQSRDRLHAALDAYRGLGDPPDPILVSATEQVIFEQTLDLPRDELRAGFTMLRLTHHVDPRAATSFAIWATAISTPWEIERARRVFRALFEGAQGPLPNGFDHAAALEMHRLETSLAETTPMARLLFPPIESFMMSDQRNEVDRRVLEQIIALRSWQIAHEGHLPDRLDDLVPTELDRLPDDPYRPGHPFGYVRSDGGAIPPAGMMVWSTTGGVPNRETEGDRLLYSVGPDRVDGRGLPMINPGNLYSGGDLVFPIPDAGSAAPAPAREPVDQGGSPASGPAP